MKSLLLKMVLLLSFMYCGIIVKAQVKTIEAINITQADTFALKGRPDQPVLKINIRVNGSTGTLSLQNLIVHTLNEDNADVDSVTVYYTNAWNRFSLVDYPGEAFRLSSPQKPQGDSIILSDLSHVLESGDNYFWVTMKLNQYSRASHSLDAYIKKNQIIVNSVNYPDADASPAGNVLIYDIYFKDNFEVPKLNGEPADWTQEQVNSSPVRWKNYFGGFGLGVSGHPDAPKSGKWNVMLQRQETTPQTTILVSKPLDLSLSTRPLLTFYHAQETWNKGGGILQNDELRVLYKVGETGTWQELKKYELPTPLLTWVKREILLPQGISDLYLGLEGTTKYGYGVCVDSVTIYETQIVNREVNSVIVRQPYTEIVPQGNNMNPVMRMNIRIKGNTGSIQLNSVKITSGNTADTDIKPLGVKLFYTNDSIFQSPVQWGTSQSFENGTVSFTGLDKSMETGENYLWITCDVDENAVPGHILDAKILPGDIVFSVAGTYPSTEQDPAGSRTIKQTLFFDDFETAGSWTLSGEFQIGTPTGLGGGAGYPDPTLAYSGSKVLGTDLDGNGNYELNIPADNPYTAQSPLISARYYQNLQFDFYRFLNIDNTDSAYIEYKPEGSSSWQKLWVNSRRYVDTKWYQHPVINLDFLERKNFNLRFRLGPTDAIDNYSGWNIDYMMITADYIPYDASVVRITYPNSSCDLSSNEKVKAYIKNTGPAPLVNIPVRLSIDGGQTFVDEVIPGTIAIDDSIEYEFTHASDFSKNAVYKIVVKTGYPGDNYPKNDTLSRQIVSFPTYNLPYANSFENDTNFWIASGVQSSWKEGYPYGSFISYPASGEKCWKTDNGGYHNLKEYSYVESPCFAFSGKEIPMMDLQYNVYTSDTLKGAVLEYSLDQGTSWQYISEDSYAFTPDWYIKDIVSLSQKGWTKRTQNEAGSQVWKKGRQVLPSATAGQPKIKFRFVFKADESATSRDEGFAFDDVKIYDAPFDLGVAELVDFSNPACQYRNNPLLKVAVKNFGIKSMHPGDTIIIGVKVDNQPQVVDTFKLTGDFLKDDTVHLRMKKPVSMNTPGTHQVMAFTLVEKEKFFYGPVSNDTLKTNLLINANPIPGLPDTIKTAHPDTVILKTNVEPNCSYEWNNGSTGTTLALSDSGSYWVKATNSLSGCRTTDSTYISLLIPDIGIESVVSPVNNCGYGKAFHPVIRIKNLGSDTLRRNDSIFVSMKLDGGSYQKDTLLLPADLSPDSIYQTGTGIAFDLSAAKDYSLISFVKMKYDTAARNDTIKTTFTIYGFPAVFLGNDTIIRDRFSYELDGGEGFTSWSWSNGTNAQKMTVTESGEYALTVTDGKGCKNSDTIRIHLAIHDLSIKRLASPLDACSQTATTSVNCVIMNTGTDTIRITEPIILSWQMNNGNIEADTIYRELKPSDSLQYTYRKKVDMSLTGQYNFKLKSRLTNDLRPENDSIIKTVEVYGIPQVDLGKDRIVKSLTYTLSPGKFDSYLWQDNSTDSVWTITQNKFESNNEYRVTVKNAYGCSDRDTVTIYHIVNDLGITGIDLPTSICTGAGKENIIITLTNQGNAKLTDIKGIIASYTLNSGTEVKDTLSFSGEAGTSVPHTFRVPVDMSADGTYNFKFSLKMPGDVNPVNDTVTFATRVLGNPTFSFGAPNDTFIVKFPYTLHSVPGYPEYLWQDNSTDSVFTITKENYKPENNPYSVIITDENGCSITGHVNVVEARMDLAVTGINASLNYCASLSEKLNVTIRNNSNIPVSNQEVTLKYTVNAGDTISQKTVVNLAKGASQTFTFDTELRIPSAGKYNLRIDVPYAEDVNTLDNNRTYEINIYSSPVINFGVARDTVRTSTFPYTLDAGPDYKSYKWNDNSTDRYLNAQKEGNYIVSVTDINNCSARDSVYILNTTGTESLEKSADIKLYPNPAYNYLFISVNLDKKQNLKMELINPEGKVIYQKAMNNITEFRDEIDVSGFPEGFYFVRFYAEGKAQVYKIVVK